MEFDKIKPTGKNVLFIRDKVEEKRYGSIILSDIRDYDARWGTVLAVGPGRYLDGKYVPLLVEPGDRIMVSSFDGDALSINNERVQMVTEDVIIARIKAGDISPDMSRSDS